LFVTRIEFVQLFIGGATVVLMIFSLVDYLGIEDLNRIRHKSEYNAISMYGDDWKKRNSTMQSNDGNTDYYKPRLEIFSDYI